MPTKQSGFRKKRSTATALLDVIDDILAAQNDGCASILVLLDFSRAFDTINTTLLLSKLAYYGFDPRTINWFATYLSGRSQRVEVKNNEGFVMSSREVLTTRGVPQGSILGPILFILYSADIVKSISNCKFHLYADDLQIYTSFKPEHTDLAVETLNQDLDQIAQWARINSLVLNPIKSKYLVLGTKHGIANTLFHNPQVRILQENIARVEEARNLGILMDGKLRFENHVLETVRNCFYRLKVLYRVRDYLNTEMRMKLCESLILSKLNYADTVIGECLLTRTRLLIQRVQNACARFCFPIPHRAHVTPYLNNFRLLRMEVRRGLHLASLLFEIIASGQPSYLFEKLTISRMHIRQAPRLVCPRCRLASFRGSFRYAATRCWNNIPPPIRKSDSLFTFKRKLKQHLFTDQVYTT